MALTEPQLQELCKQHGLHSSGEKDILLNRLKQYGIPTTKRKLDGYQEDNDQIGEKAKTKEEGPSVKQLQDLCFIRRISEKGDKAALKARIEAHDRGEEEPGEECPICGNTRVSESYGGSSHDPKDASANHGHGQECRWCSGDHIMSRLSDGIPPEDIDCMWCTKPFTQVDIRRHLSKNKLDYQVYLGTESWRAHWELPNFYLCQALGCSEGGIIEADDITNQCTRFNCCFDGTGHENCIPCKAIRKPGETCKEYQALNHIDCPIDEASQLLRNYVSKPCPRCGIYIFKTACHQIKCIAEVRSKIKCGHVFCYDCGKHRNDDDGYRKTWHEDGCPRDKAGTIGAERKRKFELSWEN